ncbi:MAG: hypothetical protein PHY30_03485 [Candidatus Pacebacteria bacterium]|nr:hypothetical protein [Candidatus Paceibacterota bacterium]
MINELIKKQGSNGSFENSILSTSLVLLCLDFETKNKALNWLLEHKNKDWSFDNNVATNFCALSAILKHDPSLIDGKALAKILGILVSLEVKEGGPYYSNISGDSIDIGVNTTIAYFLYLEDVNLLNLDAFIDKCIKDQNFNSDVIENKYIIIYLISKFLKNENSKRLLTDFLLKEDPQSSLNNALILNSLLNLGYDSKLLTNKYFKEDGSCLSIAFNIELEERKRAKQVQLESFLNKKEEDVINHILRLAKQRFKNLPLEMQEIAMKEIKKTMKGNKDKQMSLMAYYTKEALGSKAKKINDNTIAEMGLANIFFWTAFIIYDDFWDEDEAQNPQILPTANLYARHYVNYFSSLFGSKSSFNFFFHDLMDKLDSANTWETMHCRAKVNGSKFLIPEKLPEYGEYDFKFLPSSGHILGPIALFYSLGYEIDSPEIKNLISYFKNYLIAMQINDDAHDLEEDLGRGHVSTAVAPLIQDYIKIYPNKKEIDLNIDLEELKKIFWFQTIENVSEKAIYHSKKAKEALRSIHILENIKPLKYYADLTQNVAKKALTEQKNSIELLESLPFLQ